MNNPELSPEESSAMIDALRNVLWQAYVLLNSRVESVDLTDDERAFNVTVIALFEKPFHEFGYKTDLVLEVISAASQFYPDKVDIEQLRSALRKINGTEWMRKPRTES